MRFKEILICWSYAKRKTDKNYSVFRHPPFSAKYGILLGQNTQDSLSLVLKEVVQDEEWPPDMAIATGDLSHDQTSESYTRLRDNFQTLGVSVYCLPGNHDNPAFSDARIYQFCNNTAVNYQLETPSQKYFFTHGQNFLFPKERIFKSYFFRLLLGENQPGHAWD